MHAALPLVVLYFPATQAVHGPASGPVNPALHAIVTQAVADELPVGEVLPAGQVMHALIPNPPEYVPTRQFVHTVEELAATTIEYFPASQFVHPIAATAIEYEPARQLVHAAEELAPDAPENFPTEHPMHVLAPSTSEYDPAGQIWQFPDDPYVPGAQAGFTHTLAPAVDVLPAGQSVQTVAAVFEYFPLEQAVQPGTIVASAPHSQQLGFAPALHTFSIFVGHCSISTPTQ